MKHTWLSLVCLFYSLCTYTNPILVAVLMVKNEAPVMQMTLQPLVDAGITDYLIYDTGSTDNTIQVTQEFFKENNINSYVIEQGPWIDFATSRNQALQLGQQHFPQATFILMLDAEWILHNGADLLKFCLQEKNNPSQLYLIQLKGFNIEFSHARLIRTKSDLAFVGKVHEFINITPQARVPSDIYFQLSPTHYGKEKSHARWLRDRDLLLEELEEDPENPRIVFYLAQTFFCLQDWQNAAKWYEYRTTMRGWQEEDFLAFFILAQTYDLLGEPEKMITNYLKAFSIRPCRAEPLIRLAEHFYHVNSYELCYLFARHAVTIPYPSWDIAFIESELYTFLRYDLLSKTAYMMGDFALGKQATLKAIQAHPELDYLHQNLKAYQEKLGT